MDPIRVGRIVRALRQRQRWRQVDLARAAGVSQPVVSRLEAGHLRSLPVGTVEAVLEALGAGCRFEVSWRGGELDRLLDDRHASLVGEVVRRLERLGWEVQVEVSFSVYGERGSIDVLAWHPAARALAVVEVKTELTSVEETLRKPSRSGCVVQWAAWQPSSSYHLFVVGMVGGGPPLRRASGGLVPDLQWLRRAWAVAPRAAWRPTLGGMELGGAPTIRRRNGW